jgi:hypothetical protein
MAWQPLPPNSSPRSGPKGDLVQTNLFATALGRGKSRLPIKVNENNYLNLYGQYLVNIYETNKQEGEAF